MTEDFHCKCCVRRKNREYYINHKEEQKIKAMKYYQNNKSKIINMSIKYRYSHLKKCGNPECNNMMMSMSKVCRPCYRKRLLIG